MTQHDCTAIEPRRGEDSGAEQGGGNAAAHERTLVVVAHGRVGSVVIGWHVGPLDKRSMIVWGSSFLAPPPLICRGLMWNVSNVLSFFG